MDSSIRCPKIPTAGYWRLLYLKFRIWLGKKVIAQIVVKPRRKGASVLRCPVINISPFTCIKISSDPVEIAAMAYVRRATTLPVPRIYGAWVNPEKPSRCFLLMERVPGVTLEDAWKSLDRQARKKLARKLRGYLQQLRSISQPLDLQGHFASIVGGPIRDGALSVTSAKGPFPNAHDFFDYLLQLISKRNPLKQEYRELLGGNGQVPIYLTHGTFRLVTLSLIRILHGSLVSSIGQHVHGCLHIGRGSRLPLQARTPLPEWPSSTKQSDHGRRR